MYKYVMNFGHDKRGMLMRMSYVTWHVMAVLCKATPDNLGGLYVYMCSRIFGLLMCASIGPM